MRPLPLLLLLLLITLALPSCGKRTVAGGGATTTATDAPGKIRVERLLRSVEDAKVSTPYLETRAKLDLRSERLSIGGTATIRLAKDEAIWLVAKKFGFEAARALIRPDSFFLINRLEGEYIAEPLSYVEQKYKIPARFDLLQDIILGNGVFFTDKYRLEAPTAGGYVLSGRDERFDTRYVIDPASYQVRDMRLNELGQSRTLLVENRDFGPVDGLAQPFPRRRRIAIEGAGKNDASVSMEFERLNTAGPFSMPFSRR